MLSWQKNLRILRFLLLQGRALAARQVIRPVHYPQFDTKEKAQALVEQFIAGTPPKLLP